MPSKKIIKNSHIQKVWFDFVDDLGKEKKSKNTNFKLYTIK
jgi:hypothetical protein